MWERQYEHGRWNGHRLNILSTSIDGGKRLHVSEIPYGELPHIRVMGSKARNINLEVIFVGPASLADANAFISDLEETPEGELEHPWLGELPLTFESFSQSISTKRGVVTLSLTFVRSGVSPTITAPTIVRSKQQARVVENVSAKSFSKDVESMSVAEVNQTQKDYKESLNVLVDITNRLNLADDELNDINHSINEASSAISSLSNQPDEFADLFGTAVDSVADGVQAEPDSPSEAVDNSRNAQALMLNQMKEGAPSDHYNVQMVTGAVKMSKDLTKLEQSDSFDITTATKQPTIMESDLSALMDGLDTCISETTLVSTMESMELFDSLTDLKGNLQSQHDKLITGCMPQRSVELPKFRPALVIAHDEYTKENVLTALNSLQHPLFMRGDIDVRDA
ncbi:DNA circularization N-terminal domain-containing protein [Vibrio sp. JC009]|uniref:DNA circularization N-terminal domain-containing protein n=1 Tax=Vibrio sp. JC009 TaxID=2912314 RepID=UPI0023B0EA3C|nr:DNA circularization N-terminal domain-containing protein [Vibrio sp. JC009]WED23497.1 DNA circularization N-terminal domain-containing protein [Vibrio sp. JC009]